MIDQLYIFCAEYLIYGVPLAALVFFLHQKEKVKEKILIFAFISVPIMYLVAFGLGAIFDNPRPFVVGDFIPLVTHYADNGFPSRHTLFAGAVAAIIFAFHRKLGEVLFLVAVIIGFSRVQVGVHHPIDILASLVITFVVGWLVGYFLKQRKFFKK